MTPFSSDSNTSLIPPVSVVLVRPMYPRNIGQVSRAMANMGFSRLLLVSPQCDLNEEAREGAARGQGPLANAHIYSSWDEFYQCEPDGIRVAFSRRTGKMRPVRSWKDCITNSAQHYLKKRPLFLFFGPEDAGLDIEDLERVNHICELPIFGEHGSMNLSHAVLIALYMLQDQLHFNEKVSYETKVERHIYPDDIIKNWLETLGFDLSKRRITAHTTLRRILLENAITPKEWNTLEAIIQQTIRKLKKNNE